MWKYWNEGIGNFQFSIRDATEYYFTAASIAEKRLRRKGASSLFVYQSVYTGNGSRRRSMNGIECLDFGS